ncbi:extracellular solute-binding protein [Magnetospirillum molischianum]|uniref:Spermidine/putrescine-binding periplasmic protein n=1 Tax=Magnetospirillum molischianum DSM 120 TaxID=1150626 RepID=H8FTM9_MAGML|nr:extracellular solute-binding protein [Magnetospirillum molischianum]CCG41736.1 Spermidine/putrescine-binding periplasmic protein [Magnetospirillum molischianum DSM 120]
MDSPRRGVAAILFLLSVLLAFPAPALASSELRILARTATLSPELIEKFKRETGIAVDVTEVADHAEMIRRLRTSPPGFDIAFPSDHHVAGLIGQGGLERIWADRLPGFWNIEDPWRSRSFDPRNEYTIPHQWGTISFTVDTTVHKGDIDSLSLLFSPPAELDRRIGLLDDSVMLRLALIQAGEPRCTSDPARLDRAVTLLKPLMARARLIPISQVASALRNETLALAVTTSGDAMRARDERPTLAYAYPREGNLVWTDVVAVPRHPPNRTNALKFIAFMLRPENAALDTNYNGYATMIRGAEAHLRPEVLSAPELVAPWPAKVGFLVSCNPEIHRYHDMVWSNIRTGE